MITLYHAEPALYSLKPLIALEEKGVAFNRKPIGQVPLERAVPGYPAQMEHRINVEREGPVLVDGDTMISGSFFLLEYIAETEGGVSLLPDDALGRYEVQGIGQSVAGLIAPFVSALGVARYPVPALADDAGIEPVERRDSWAMASRGGTGEGLADRLRPTLAKLEARLATSAWLVGDYSIADIDVFAMIRNLPDLAPGLIDGGDTPRLADFVARMEARPAVQRALAMTWGGDAARTFLPGPEISRWG
jgi:glutathione S-transferase/GST-like protein